METVRFALPRNNYDDKVLLGQLEAIGMAYKDGLFAKIKHGLRLKDYKGHNWHFFNTQFEYVDRKEF